MVGSISDWYEVSFDDDFIHIKVEPPDRDEINASIRWDEIIRICFKTGGLYESDEILIFIRSRPESYLIPSEAFGGADLWGEIVGRDLFDATLAIKAATSPGGELFCWPKD